MKHGYICNNVYKAFNTYHNNNEMLAILCMTVDNFVLPFKNPAIRDEFFEFMTITFNVTTQPQLKFLSLRIYQSEYGISVDQTQHIYKKFLT